MSSSLFSESGKGERHVFCKNKKYNTLCSVALGTMVTAIVAWGSAVAQADEVTTPLISETNYNGNPNYTFRKLSGVSVLSTQRNKKDMLTKYKNVSISFLFFYGKVLKSLSHDLSVMIRIESYQEADNLIKYICE